MKNITNKIAVYRYHFSPPTWFYKKNCAKLNAGSSDDLYFILHDDRLLLMSVNSRMDYVGIEVYDPNTLEMVADYFVQSVNDGFSPLYGRRDFFSYTWYTMARKLYTLAMKTL